MSDIDYTKLLWQNKEELNNELNIAKINEIKLKKYNNMFQYQDKDAIQSEDYISKDSKTYIPTITFKGYYDLLINTDCIGSIEKCFNSIGKNFDLICSMIILTLNKEIDEAMILAMQENDLEYKKTLEEYVEVLKEKKSIITKLKGGRTYVRT